MSTSGEWLSEALGGENGVQDLVDRSLADLGYADVEVARPRKLKARTGQGLVLKSQGAQDASALYAKMFGASDRKRAKGAADVRTFALRYGNKPNPRVVDPEANRAFRSRWGNREKPKTFDAATLQRFRGRFGNYPRQVQRR